MQNRSKDPFWKSPLFLRRGPGVPSPSRLCPAFDERRHSEWGLHHLPPWRAQPEATGVLRHDHGWGWLDCKYTELLSVHANTRRCSRPPGSAPVGPNFTTLFPSLHLPPPHHVPRGGPSLSSGPLLCSPITGLPSREQNSMSRLQWPGLGGGAPSVRTGHAEGGAAEGRVAQPGPGSCLPGTVAVIKEEELSLYGEDPSTGRRHTGEHRRGTTRIVTSSYKGYPTPILPWLPWFFPRAVTAFREHLWSGKERHYFLPPPSSHV